MANSAAPAGNQQPPQTPAVDPCAEAKQAALDAAETVRDPKKTRPRAASGLRASNGDKAGGCSGGGNNKNVEALARKMREIVPKDSRGYANNCGCAELNCISNAMAKGIPLKGAVIATIEVKGVASTSGRHGKPMEACEVCEKVLEKLGITDCAGE